MIRLRDNRFDLLARKFEQQADKISSDPVDDLPAVDISQDPAPAEVRKLLKDYSGKNLAKLREMSNGNLITLGRVKKEENDDPAFFTLRELSETRFALDTSNLMGVLRLRDPANGTSVQIEVHSRFDKGENQPFLNYLLSKVFRVDFMGSAAMGNDRLWDILAAILFIQKLKAAVPVGLYKEYKRFEENDLNFRGRLDLARHLRQNYPLQDKIAYSYRAITFDNPVNHLLRSAVEVIQRKYPELLYSDNEIKNFVSALKNATPTWTSACNRDLLRAPVCRESLRHPFFAEYYEAPRSLAKMILEEEGYSIYDKTCEDEVSGVIFDGAWLWEEYIATILTPLGFIHADPDSKTGGCKIFIGEEQMGQENIYPDFFHKEKKIVLDTKYNMDTEKREDIFQVLSYALITGSTYCGLIYPPTKSGESRCCKTVGVNNGFNQDIKWHSIAFSKLKGDIVGFMHKQEENLKEAIEEMA